MRRIHLIYISVVILLSSCHQSEFHRARYPSQLKHGKTQKIENQSISETKLYLVHEKSPEAVETLPEESSRILDIREDEPVEILELSVIRESDSPQEFNSDMDSLPNFKMTESIPNSSVDDEKPILNKKSVRANLLVYAMSLIMVLAILLLLNDLVVLAWLLALFILVGLFYIARMAFRGRQDSDQTRFPGLNKFLSVLSIIAVALTTILFIGFMIYISIES